jgi:hypothetical protein
MTIFHKSMLAGAAVIAGYEDDPRLNTVLLEPSGEVISANTWAIFVSEPTPTMTKNALPLTEKPLKNAVAFSVNQINDLVKAIPADKQFKSLLEHVSIIHDEGNIYRAEFNNGRGTQSVIMRSMPVSKILTTWRNELRTLGNPAPFSKLVYNRARLETVVLGIKTACKYSGEFEVIDQKPFSNGCVWSVKNGQTGQTVLITWIMSKANYSESTWERTVFQREKNLLIRPKARPRP